MAADAGMKRILVTGATGFVGRALCASLAGVGVAVRRALRAASAERGADDVIVGDIGPGTRWDQALTGVDAVVHLAARTHVMRETVDDSLALYRAINVEGTRALAAAAAGAGVKRFVFLSSIKVNGESTADKAYAESDAPRPEDAYGISKWEAEQALASIARDSKLETVVLRPPLIYGPGVKGNFLSLMRAIDRGLPLPLASIDNRRSLLYLGNVVSAIGLLLTHPQAAAQTFLLADDDVGISTPALIRAIAAALGRRARLYPFPPALLLAMAALARRGAAAQRLTGSLVVDSGAIRNSLGWQPVASLAAGLDSTARWYHRRVAAPSA
jgi:nucleoside-diphosphate-sugar epimerase